MINLILGLLKTSSGEILIDKKNISEIQKKWLSEIGYVPQNVFLFDDSIKENIILSKKRTHRCRVVEQSFTNFSMQ